MQIFELASDRLAQTLHDLGNQKELKGDVGLIITSAISDAWTMIDSTHRLRQLLQQLPRMKKNTAELQLFLRRTTPVEDLRHYFQHLRGEIHSIAEMAMPLWGTIAWSQPNPETGLLETHMINPGTFFDGIGVGSCTFNSQQGKFVERVLLHAGPQKLDLADLYDYIKEFASWYIKWFETIFTSEKRHGADVHIKFFIEPVTEINVT